MTQASTSTRRGSPAGWVALLQPNFVIAVIILSLTAILWEETRYRLGLVFMKEPVPWPIGQEVNDKHRLTTLANDFGDYAKFCPDPNTDGETDIDEDTRATLGIGGDDLDKKRRPDRRSNWYVVRLYLDKRAEAYSLWSLGVYYYTGGVDPVPHTPEVCLVSGGMSVTQRDVVPMTLSGTPAAGWQEVKVCRVLYRNKLGKQFADYYTFCVNGLPQHDRTAVRFELMDPRVRYNYFAKIEFSPRQEVTNLEASDRAAREFLSSALPKVLETLPTSDDVKKINEAGKKKPD
jgi:hypothetical protein